MSQKKIGIIGGGASGIMAAIAAAREGAQVTVFEKNDRIGKKILATGNGKCNLSNVDTGLSNYYVDEDHFLKRVFDKFSFHDTLLFFHDIGLETKEKNGGIYPISEQASSVLDCLRYEVDHLGITVKTSVTVNKIRKEGNKFTIYSDATKVNFDAVVITCGGKAAPKSGSDGSGYDIAKAFGHKIKKTVPGLGQLRCKEEWFKAISGVRCEAFISFKDDQNRNISERGELQLTDYGISGIPVFQLSRTVNYMLSNGKSPVIHIDFLPDMDIDYLYNEYLQKRKERFINYTAEEYFTGLLNKKLMLLFIKIAGIKTTDYIRNIPEDRLRKVFSLCKDLTVHVVADNGFENAQVTAGGIYLSEIKDTMESVIVDQLYFAGEILDVDAKCGGFNLQWAWSSGYVAGKNAAK